MFLWQDKLFKPDQILKISSQQINFSDRNAAPIQPSILQEAGSYALFKGS